MSTFDEVAGAVERGDCILERKGALGADSPPHLRSQRSRAGWCGMGWRVFGLDNVGGPSQALLVFAMLRVCLLSYNALR